jgi:hypothetical protein
VQDRQNRKDKIEYTEQIARYIYIYKQRHKHITYLYYMVNMISTIFKRLVNMTRAGGCYRSGQPGSIKSINQIHLLRYCGDPAISHDYHHVSLVQWTNLFASRHKGHRFKSPGGYLCGTGILLLALSRYNTDNP